MALRLIVYVSTSLIPPAFSEREIADLVTQARQRNDREGVSGALLYSEHERFAQALEGEEAAISHIMESIRRDTRHAKINMLHDSPISERRFSGWSLAYCGYAPRIDFAIQNAEYGANRASDEALRELLG